MVTLLFEFDRGDKYHKEVFSFLENFDGKLITTWAVITEVSHTLDFNLNVQIDFLTWIELGAIRVYEIQQNDLKEIIPMIKKYTNVPMDLAESSLMFVAKKENIKNIVSIDSDFDIYRTLKSGFLNNLLRSCR
jgi:predicted nucleic acid-binding protein